MKILLAYDGSKCADAAIEDLKRAGLGRDVEMLVVCVAGESSAPTKQGAIEIPDFANLWTTGLSEAEKLAQSARERLQSYFPGWKTASEAIWGDTVKSILKTAERFAPDLLVVGSHGRSAVTRLVLGSASLSLLHHAACSVRIVRERPAAEGPIRILIASDGSSSAQAVLQEVSRRSWPDGTKARIVSIVESLVPQPTIPALEANTFATEPAFQVILAADARERARLKSVVDSSAKVLESAGLTVDPVVLEGMARTELLSDAKAWEAETIFIGARGVGTMERLLLGSVSTAIVTHAGCAVEVVRHASR